MPDADGSATDRLRIRVYGVHAFRIRGHSILTIADSSGIMADSYAQLAKRSAIVHHGVCAPTGADRGRPLNLLTSSVSTHDLEDKVLSLAKLLKSSQLCHADHVSDHKASMQMLSARLQKLEEAVGQQTICNSFASGPNAYNIKALAERMELVESRLMEGLSENHDVHAHNAKVGAAAAAATEDRQAVVGYL